MLECYSLMMHQQWCFGGWCHRHPRRPQVRNRDEVTSFSARAGCLVWRVVLLELCSDVLFERKGRRRGENGRFQGFCDSRCAPFFRARLGVAVAPAPSLRLSLQCFTGKRLTPKVCFLSTSSNTPIVAFILFF